MSRQLVRQLVPRVLARESGQNSNNIPIYGMQFGECRRLCKENGLFLPTSTYTKEVNHEAIVDVSGACVLTNVLTEAECDTLIKFSEYCGYTQDTPVSLGRDVRQNDACVFIAETDLSETIFQRCRAHLPSHVPGLQSRADSAVHVGPVCGLNNRWRLYRYSRDDTFRMHRDGGWANTRLCEETGRLLRPSSDPAQIDSFSFYTFLIYLNDSFTGGETIFWVPRKGKPLSNRPITMQDLMPVPVRPKKGSVLVFPHGANPVGSHLHEGGIVLSGCKYVCRTDLLYRIEHCEQPETSAINGRDRGTSRL